MQPHHILILTPSDLLGAGMKHVLERNHYRVSVHNEVTVTHNATLIIVDACLMTDSIAHLLTKLQRESVNVPIVIMSDSCDEVDVWQAIQSGTKGFLCLRDHLVPMLPHIIADLVRGDFYLSPSAQTALATFQFYQNTTLTSYQQDVLRLMRKHWSAGRIAQDLGRSPAAIYQVQRYLRDLFDAENNGELLEFIARLEVLH